MALCLKCVVFPRSIHTLNKQPITFNCISRNHCWTQGYQTTKLQVAKSMYELNFPCHAFIPLYVLLPTNIGSIPSRKVMVIPFSRILLAEIVRETHHSLSLKRARETSMYMSLLSTRLLLPHSSSSSTHPLLPKHFLHPLVGQLHPQESRRIRWDRSR